MFINLSSIVLSLKIPVLLDPFVRPFLLSEGKKNVNKTFQHFFRVTLAPLTPPPPPGGVWAPRRTTPTREILGHRGIGVEYPPHRLALLIR